MPRSPVKIKFGPGDANAPVANFRGKKSSLQFGAAPAKFSGRRTQLNFGPKPVKNNSSLKFGPAPAKFRGPKGSLAFGPASPKFSGKVAPGLVIVGLEDAIANLLTFEPTLQKKVLRSAIRKAARPIQKHAKANVPKETGQLASTITIRALKRSRRYKHRVGVKVWTDAKKLEEVHDEAEHFFNPHWIEFGVPFHQYFGNALDPLPAQPFMRPAVNQGRNQALVEFRRGLLGAI